ncbi:MAG: D-ribose pyranase [Lachnospiraceae bacterium]|nr:D-ribose pyranase [Lachnospiraceae bacterium]
MKKHGIYNKALMTAIADMGHEEYIIVGDAGVPIADPAKRIDLAVAKDLPTIAQVLDLIMDEFIFEDVIVAQEQKDYNPQHYKAVEDMVHARYETMEVKTMAHYDLFAEYLPKAKYIVRTGDLMPWGNVVLKAGIDAKVWFQKPGAITPGFYEERAAYDNE